MKLNFFRNVISNIIIFVLIISIYCFATVSSSTKLIASEFGSSEAIYRGNISNKNVSLMINVYWGTEFLDSMLEILNEENVKVTFFVGGIWATKNAEYLKKFNENGHEIGNHGFNHKDHDKLSVDGNKQEISSTHSIVKSITNVEMTLFAPPSGAYNTTTLQVANALGYKTIMWTLDTIDWRDKDENLILSRATKKYQNGALILMHPTEKTVEALPEIIKFYKDKGFNLTTVTQNIQSSW